MTPFFPHPDVFSFVDHRLLGKGLINSEYQLCIKELC